MKKFLIIGAVIIVVMFFALQAHAASQKTSLFTAEYSVSTGYADIAKFYDASTKVVCYETKNGKDSNLSCVKL